MAATSCLRATTAISTRPISGRTAWSPGYRVESIGSSADLALRAAQAGPTPSAAPCAGVRASLPGNFALCSPLQMSGIFLEPGPRIATIFPGMSSSTVTIR